jgi:hypothetical protein
MSSEADLVALLRRCHLEPMSPMPRRVVADWLEENGSSEAEAALAGLLRRAERISYDYTDPLPEDCKDRNLAKRHKAAWLGGLTEGRRWGFEHGLFSVYCQAQDLADGTLPRPPLRGGVAWLARLKVEEVTADIITDVLSSPWLDGFQGVLCIVREDDSLGLPALLASQPHLRAITGLCLSYRPLTAEFPALCREGPWGEIVTLELMHSGLGSPEIQVLADSPLGQHLRLFDARNNQIGSPGVVALCRACPNLGVLNLLYNRVSDPGMKAISQLRSLRWLGLYENRRITVAGVEALLNGAPAASLQYLGLPNIRLGDQLCRIIADAHLPNLKGLDISGERKMTVEGVRMLVESDRLPSLVRLGVPSGLNRSVPTRPGLSFGGGVD